MPRQICPPLLLVNLILATSVAAAHPKISKDLEKADPGGSIDAIVQYTHPPDQGDHERVKAKGGELKPELNVVRAAAYSVNANIALQYGFDGRGIGVAVIDSGILGHPDLKNSSGASRIVYSQDFAGGGTND